MDFQIQFSEEKNLLLKATRGICFDDVLDAIVKGQILDNLKHYSKKHSKQKLLVVRIKKYIYAVPYVLDKNKKTIFLKTVYPSRVLYKKYKGGQI